MYKLWNNFKTTLLLGGLMGLCLGVGYLLGGRGALIPAFLIGGAMNVVAFFFSDKIALATMHAEEITRDDDPELWDTVGELATRARLPMPRVYISPAEAPNAFATGRSPRHSAVCVTAGLRRMLDQRELAGVIGHEMSHVKHRDMLIGTIAAVIAGAISILSYFAFWFGGGDDDNIVVALALMIFAPMAAGLIQLAISRSREYEADRLGAQLAGSPRGLAGALRKLDSASRRIPLRVPDTQSGLFIVKPLTGRRMTGLFMSHPPIEDRIARLMAMEK